MFEMKRKSPPLIRALLQEVSRGEEKERNEESEKCYLPEGPHFHSPGGQNFAPQPPHAPQPIPPQLDEGAWSPAPGSAEPHYMMM